MDNLGDILRETRISHQLSQIETSDNICSQSTLSEIENNKYNPSTQLLIDLCQRMSISFEEIILAQNFKVCRDIQLNKRISTLYNAHNYQDLNLFLVRKRVLADVQTDKHTQAYYFYLSLCALHLDHKLDHTKELIKLSLASSNNSRKQTTLTRLGNIILAYIYSKQNLRSSSIQQIKMALNNIENVKYEENLNIIYFVAALSYFQISRYKPALDMVRRGINFSQRNASAFMLINNFYLLAYIKKTVCERRLKIKHSNIHKYSNKKIRKLPATAFYKTV